ncbi:hypothetical protein DERF_007440 [Dermatophagoides farinae]|uniref:Uncharacterized protein n=1 Tax=Dermatophagoides farinae TaxID=6954 RepID=A0A922L354_DERFA|nr:hypothetical protein DERF_007440 [Dermatophagoides farinae]
MNIKEKKIKKLIATSKIVHRHLLFNTDYTLHITLIIEIHYRVQYSRQKKRIVISFVPRSLNSITNPDIQIRAKIYDDHNNNNNNKLPFNMCLLVSDTRDRIIHNFNVDPHCRRRRKRSRSLSLGLLCLRQPH